MAKEAMVELFADGLKIGEVDRDTFDFAKLRILEGKKTIEVVRELIRNDFQRHHAINIALNARREFEMEQEELKRKEKIDRIVGRGRNKS